MPFALSNPSGLCLLALLGPLAALYFLRSRRTRRVVSSLVLFRAAVDDRAATSSLRRVLLDVTFFFEGVTLVFLALALSGPVRRGGSPVDDRVVIVVDTSASMAATTNGAIRFELARAWIHDYLGRLPARTEAAIVDAAAEPAPLGAFTRDRGTLGRMVDRLRVREGHSDLPSALVLALDRLGKGAGSRRVVVVTDVNGDVPFTDRAPTQIVRVGNFDDNVGIDGVTVRRTSDPSSHDDEASVFVAARNFGARHTTRLVSVRSARGDLLGSRELDIEPGGRAYATLSFTVQPKDTGKGILVDVTPSDALAVDDRAFALLPPGPTLPVVITPPGRGPWLRRALAADPGVELFEAPPGALDSARVPEGALVVSVGVCPVAPPLADLLVIDPPPGDCLGVGVGDVVRDPPITTWSDRDPRFRFLALSDLHVHLARSLVAPRMAALLTSGETPLISDLSLAGRTGTLVSFDPTESDWPLRVSFVLFVRNIAELARSDRQRALGSPAWTDDILRIPVASGTSMVTIRGPSGDVRARAVDGVAIEPPVSKAGIYEALGPDGIVIASKAVNLEPGVESDLRHVPATSSPSAAFTNATFPSEPREGSDASPFLLVLALSCILAESLWFMRRRRPRVTSVPSLTVGSTLVMIGIAVATYAVLTRDSPDAHWLTFERPLWTLVAVASATFAAVVAFLAPAAPHLVRRAMVDTASILAALILGIALAGPLLVVGFDRLSIVVAVDRSRSMDLVQGPTIDGEIQRAEQRMKPGDQLGVVAFGSDAALEEPLHPRGGGGASARAIVNRDGTDIAAGIRRALAAVPRGDGARIVLVSDGDATRGDTDDAALAAALAGIPVDVVPRERRPAPNVRLVSLKAPRHAAENESIDLRVTTEATRDTEVEIRVDRDGTPRSQGRRVLHAGADVFWIRERADGGGLHRYDVNLRPKDPASDSVPEDDGASVFVRVGDRARALLLEGNLARATPIRAALLAAGFEVDVKSATEAPLGLDEFGAPDLVVLGNVPAEDLSVSQMAALGSGVRDLGGGLMLFGGDRSLGPGGYAKTPVEEVSPVAFEVPNEQRRARLAEVIAIDSSGSMSASAGGETKLALANEAAARSAALLGAIDRIGVEHVDTDARWTVPLAQLTDAADVEHRIRQAGPGGGGIFIDVALMAAYAALDGQPVETKHLLLFADGDDAENRERADAMTRAAVDRGITTSVVALGRGKDFAALERLSREGRGRFYLIEDASRLPAVFAEETTLARGDALREMPFRAAPGAPSPFTRGIDFSLAPLLSGYVVTMPKLRATVPLLAADGDPLLATWSVGLGRVSAFTSDYGGKWGASWVNWRDAARLFGELGRVLARRPDDSGIALEADASSGSLFLRDTTRTANDDALHGLTAFVAGPKGFSSRAPMQADGPGSFSAKVRLPHPGAYLTVVRDDMTNSVVGTAGAYLSAGDELSGGTDRGTLSRIARTTGGKTLSNVGRLFLDRPEPGHATRPLTPWLVVAGAFSLLLSVASRRWPGTGEPPAPSLPHGDPDAPPPSRPTSAEAVLERRRRRR